MNRVAIILAVVLLMLGAGTTRAVAESYVSSVAVSANDAALLLGDSVSAPGVFQDAEQNPGGDGGQGPLVCQSMTGGGYAISEQVTIDLQYRRSPVAENTRERVDESVDVEYITQNLMLGFNYNF